MFVLANRWIGESTVRLRELAPWNPSDETPVRLCRFEIEPVVQIDADAKAGFIRREESPEPRAEEPYVCYVQTDRSAGPDELD